MRRAGLDIILILATATAMLVACGKRDSIYLDHTRDEARAPRRAPPAAKPAEAASANTTAANAPAEAPAT